MTDHTRSIERELFIAADVEAVWRAVTQGSEIERWFAPVAESDPRLGGLIRIRWDSNTLFHDCHIVQWTPGEHLKMTWRDAPGGEHELPVDIRLERVDGGTVLRLVHSGFLSDASWDEEYDGHARGWRYELASLKYYLEEQLGRTRQFVMRRLPLYGDRVQAWRAVVGAGGLFRPDREELSVGESFALELPDGIATGAKLVLALADQDFVAIADVLEGGLFRFALEEAAGGRAELWVWAFSWRLAEAQLAALMRPCFDAIEERLAAMRAVSSPSSGAR